ncbi:Rieske 2Fe-2S domain-containing protein [uncultured Kocuria sp.]|uniref:Rieske 2Fe-2S domain-containing protein n=1 Tax=uncultured Kocuria sp. TaxID=259305 RepID=UPI00260E051B|nr:Rieske 2Fe-2S domain-containing protein [uncultured Kocuria sp.]
MKLLEDLVARVEKWKALDQVAEPVARAVGRAARPAPVRNVLSGTVIGHPLHPLLTDVPIGAWTMAAVLDLAGGPSTAHAADVLVATGLAAAVPTAATGLNDWSDTQGADRRIGLVHATANSVALTFYTASLAARLQGRRGAGKALALAGYGCVMAGGYLGGHLVYARGVNVNRTAWRRGPRRWTDVLADTDLAAGGHRRVQAGSVSVLLVRDGNRIEALDSVCSHMGGPLEKGTIDGGCVTCPWHGSTFRLADGAVVRGPATAPQPGYETRVQDGRIQLRLRS